MSQENYILNLLNIKDENLKIELCESFDGYRKNKKCKIIPAKLSYIPEYCDKCGVYFESVDDYEKKGYDDGSYVVIPSICEMDAYIFLKKQRIKCHHCNKSFVCHSDIVKPHCFISTITKIAIAKALTNKLSEKDISIRYNVSPNTVERVTDSYYDTQKLYKHYLPEVLSFDEFKSVKGADGAMSFHICNGETGKTIDIVEDRRLNNLIKYFSYYSHNARSKVKLIVIDMYSPYISLIKLMFPNAKIIIDKFHLINLISTAMNKTRINYMKNDKPNYKKFKRYWKLLLKSRDELNCSKWKRFTCFQHLMTEVDVVDYLINLSPILKSTYQTYQDLLYGFQRNDIDVINETTNNIDNNISEPMKTAVKTINGYKEYIKNTLSYKYHNGYIEGNHNFIKTLKRIAFGFRSFRRFKARILICKTLISIKKEAQICAS